VYVLPNLALEELFPMETTTSERVLRQMLAHRVLTAEQITRLYRAGRLPGFIWDCLAQAKDAPRQSRRRRGRLPR
jgi:hypothetical protein